MCKEEAPKPTKAESMAKIKALAKELDAKLYPTNKSAKKK
jgi:hypothetical protein